MYTSYKLMVPWLIRCSLIRNCTIHQHPRPCRLATTWFGTQEWVVLFQVNPPEQSRMEWRHCLGRFPSSIPCVPSSQQPVEEWWPRWNTAHIFIDLSSNYILSSIPTPSPSHLSLYPLSQFYPALSLSPSESPPPLSLSLLPLPPFLPPSPLSSTNNHILFASFSFRRCECYDYLFDIAVTMKQCGLNPTQSPST